MYEIKTKELGNKKNKNIRSENLFVTQVHMDSKWNIKISNNCNTNKNILSNSLNLLNWKYILIPLKFRIQSNY